MKANPVVYEIARWVCAALLVVFLFVLFGSNPVSSADPAAVESAVTAQIEMTNMLKADNQMIKRLYGLDPSSYESCVLYYPTTNMQAEELLIIKLADTAQAEQIETAIQARLETQKASFDGYGIEQYDMLTNNAVVEVRGNFVLFVVNAASAQAREAFLGAL